VIASKNFKWIQMYSAGMSNRCSMAFN